MSAYGTNVLLDGSLTHYALGAIVDIRISRDVIVRHS
jgi:hypothetical protein